MSGAKGVSVPVEPDYLKLNLLSDNHLCRRAMGALLYPATMCRPDIAAAVGILNKRISKPAPKRLE